MKLKDLIKAFVTNYELRIIDGKDSKELFSCRSNSKALNAYSDWDVLEIEIIPSNFGFSYGGVRLVILEVKNV